MNTEPEKQVSLYFSEGNSDKEYHAQLVNSGSGFIVNFQYGRRGQALQTGTKTASPVDHAKAVKIFDKLVSEKMAKGYSPGEQGVAFQGGSKEAQFTGVLPQLLNAIDECDVHKYLSDESFCLQQK